MHAYPSCIIAALVCAGLVAQSTEKAQSLLMAPFVFSGVVLGLSILPLVLIDIWHAISAKTQVE